MMPNLRQAARRMIPMTGWIRRRRSNASMVADFLSLRKALMLCASCEARMPRRWLSLYTYRLLPSFHGVGRCDMCRVEQPGNLYLPEDDTYMTGWVKNERIVENARRQQQMLRDGKLHKLVG